MKEKDIQRINELYNLDKSIGLTPEQKEEQRKLRHEYIQSVRANLRAQLNNVSPNCPGMPPAQMGYRR